MLLINRSKAMYLVFSLCIVFAVSSCGKGKNEENAAASMEQLHAENGQPISIRELVFEDFSVYLKYPALINASSESTAFATLSDVVRSIPAKVGDTVRQDDVIMSFSPDNQVLRQASLAHENARAAYERSSVLFRSNDISRQDFDSIRMQYELSAANFKAANDMVFVKAPISGTITQINVRVTENVRPGTPLFTVSNSGAFEARLFVGAEEIDRIQAGARAFINLSSGKQNAKSIEGRITQVSLIMDSQKQAFPVTVFFDDGNRLVSGMNVDIAVEVYRNEKAIILSRQEIIQTETGPAVFVAEGNMARRVPVKTGMEKGLRLEILDGLNEGELLISDGAQQINTQSGASQSKINIVPAVLASLH